MRVLCGFWGGVGGWVFWGVVDGWFGGPAFFFEGLCCLSCFAAMSPDRSMRPLFGGSGGDPGLCPQPPIGMGFLSQTGLLL